MSANYIKVLDGGSIHKITSGQVVVDLQTAVKELVENSLDAGATNIEVRFKQYGLESFEVIDNGSGISPNDYDSIALKHHTSKLSSFTDLEAVTTFGFRGEALSSLCALAESMTVTTATEAEAPVGTIIEFERTGKVKSRKGKTARQRGTTVTVTGLFKPLPVRRKEFERNAKREFGKALSLLHAYALVPCAQENKGTRLTVTNQMPGGSKTVQLRTDGVPSVRASVSAIWGPKALESLVELDLTFNVEIETSVLRRLGKDSGDVNANEIKVKGLVSKFSVGCGRNGTDRQFFFVNGRPCAPSKVQKTFNEVYRSFNATQSPFVIADFILPTHSCDINVSPDKRTILLHSENNLIQALRVALEEAFAPARSTFDVNPAPVAKPARVIRRADDESLEQSPHKDPLFLPDLVAEDSQEERSITPAQTLATAEAVEQEPKEPADAGDASFGEPLLLFEECPVTNPADSLDTNDLQTITHAQAQENDVGLSEGSARQDLSGSRRAETLAVSQSSPITQMFRKQQYRRSRSSTEMDVVDEKSLPQPEDPDEDEPRVSSVGLPQNSAEARRRISQFQDSPVPAVKSPVRLVTRTKSTNSAIVAAQTTLSTSGASWNLRRQPSEPSSAERPRKRGRLELEDEEPRKHSTAPRSRDARQGMRQLLQGFARPGSLDHAPMDVDDAVDDADIEKAEVEGSQHSSRQPSEEPHRANSPSPPSDSEERMDRETLVMSDMIDLTQDEIPSQSDAFQSSTTSVSEEIIRTGNRECVSLGFDMTHVVEHWKKLRARLANARRQQEIQHASLQDKGTNQDASASINADDEEATETLSRVIEKADFASMEVVGQFNLGFIIARRRKPAGEQEFTESRGLDDLFIIDQHAADEKYNFETLQQTTKIESQKLFHPQVLELTAADELIALENVDVLRQNGFEVEVFEDRPPGQRVQLIAQPISKSTVFDMKDLEELLHLLQDRPAGQMVRCSKARAMFAMRACRKSIMIGKPLNLRQMALVVQHMGTMDQPWHCPHGRPTMRHLTDISGMGWDLQQAPMGRVDWSAFGRA
ncbi:DNA mismatch repair protein MutL [Trametes coccinea BRFM310]|uniref:DNA mismatch repair protein PMS1 n=1 Tax=Trametes coccinea (strain BRFM310) TaxID=1353009 RepID=A0A1Y2IB50_TRAC3|nr:DNA mismatch repair protein MutL [Trametes coccinea BRFM310]